MMNNPIVNDTFVLEKMPGKGGWTYVFIPEIVFADTHRTLWIAVKGSIDHHSFENLHLAKVKNGGYFFPVKAEIRKVIRKQAGDRVTLVLFEDDSVFQIPEELEACLKIEPAAYAHFMGLKENQQKEFVKWIYAAKGEATRAARINTTLTKLLKGERLHPKST